MMYSIHHALSVMARLPSPSNDFDQTANRND